MLMKLHKSENGASSKPQKSWTNIPLDMGSIFKYGFDVPDEDSRKTEFVAKSDIFWNICINA